MTLIDEVLFQDPDLEAARFDILDFSCPGPKAPRTLTIIDARDIPRVDVARKNAMLEAFAEGYIQALASLSGSAPPPPEYRDEPPPLDPDQPGLFD